MEKHVYEWMVRSQLVRSDGVGRRCKVRTCSGCGEHVVRGLDGDRCAVVVSAQPGPISREVEVAAIVLGRKTFTLLPLVNAKTFPAFELIERTPSMIRRNSIWDILASHVCNSPLPTIQSRLYRELPDEAPF